MITWDELVRLAEQQYPDRPINLPDGPAAVVPTPERRAFIAGYVRARGDCRSIVQKALDLIDNLPRNG